MEYLTGVKPKETKEISELLEQVEAGAKVKVNGAVHTIRDMGTVAFVILRKREGLLQCVYEEGSADFELKDIKEAATVEVERNSEFRKDLQEHSGISCTVRSLQRSIHRRSGQKVQKAEPIFSNWNISTNRLYWHRAHSSINR